MSEVKEVCPKCGNVYFAILRDMTSRRVCKWGNTWDAPEKKDTGYKKLKRESEEYFAKWGEYMKRTHVAEAKVEELKTKLDKAVEALKEIAKDTYEANPWTVVDTMSARKAKETLRELGVEFEA